MTQRLYGLVIQNDHKPVRIFGVCLRIQGIVEIHLNWRCSWCDCGKELVVLARFPTTLDSGLCMTLTPLASTSLRGTFPAQGILPCTVLQAAQPVLTPMPSLCSNSSINNSTPAPCSGSNSICTRARKW